MPVSLLKIEPDQCRFPIGDPREKSFRFCGEPAKAGSSYCPACHAVAYLKGSATPPRAFYRDFSVREGRVANEDPVELTEVFTS